MATNQMPALQMPPHVQERLRLLAVKFKQRTISVKEKTQVQLDSDSDLDSDVDGAKGATDVQPAATGRLIRLYSHDRAARPRALLTCPPAVLCDVVDPTGFGYLAWLLLMAVTVNYNLVAIFLRSTFPYQHEHNVHYWLIADYVCDSLYLTDMFLVQTRVTYLMRTGQLERSVRHTARRYLCSRMFVLDVLSLTPLDLLYIRLGQVLPLLRLTRLLKFRFVWHFFDRLDLLSHSGYWVRIARLMIYMLLLTHIQACGYYAMSNFENFATGWTYIPGNWNAYVRCFLFAVKTITRIGKTPDPSKTIEFGFMTLYWIAGIFSSALLLSQIRDIFALAMQKKRDFRDKIDKVLDYAHCLHLPVTTSEKLRAYFDFCLSSASQLIEEDSLLSCLPDNLQTQLAVDVHYDTLSKVDMFKDCEESFLLNLVTKLHPALYMPGDYICVKGEVGQEMYIISYGMAEVVGPEGQIFATMKQGCVFGEISLLSVSQGGNRRTANVRSKGFSRLFVLNKSDFEEAMRDFPAIHKRLRRKAKKMMKKDASKGRAKAAPTGGEERQDSGDSLLSTDRIAIAPVIEPLPPTPRLFHATVQLLRPEARRSLRLTDPLLPRRQRQASLGQIQLQFVDAARAWKSLDD